MKPHEFFDSTLQRKFEDAVDSIDRRMEGWLPKLDEINGKIESIRHKLVQFQNEAEDVTTIKLTQQALASLIEARQVVYEAIVDDLKQKALIRKTSEKKPK